MTITRRLRRWVCTSVLMAMPGGKGLFQRAGVMSGSALRMMPPEYASRNAKRFMDALEIGRGDVRKLQDVPWTTLLETQARLEAELAEEARWTLDAGVLVRPLAWMDVGVVGRNLMDKRDAVDSLQQPLPGFVVQATLELHWEEGANASN